MSSTATSIRVPSPARLHRRRRVHTRVVATASPSSSDVAAMKKELLQAVANSRRLAAPVKASLKALAEGGWFTQARLHEAGLVESPTCQACGTGLALCPAFASAERAE